MTGYNAAELWTCLVSVEMSIAALVVSLFSIFWNGRYQSLEFKSFPNVTRSPYCIPILSRQNLDQQLGWDFKNCQLKIYHVEDVVQCLTQISPNSPADFRNPLLNIVFMGDSRIRQQFYSFIKVIQHEKRRKWSAWINNVTVKFLPDYDLYWQGLSAKHWEVHHDMNVVSYILNLRVSFLWRSVLDEKSINELHGMALENTPNLIIIGNSVICPIHICPIVCSIITSFQKEWQCGTWSKIHTKRSGGFKEICSGCEPNHICFQIKLKSFGWINLRFV